MNNKHLHLNLDVTLYDAFEKYDIHTYTSVIISPKEKKTPVNMEKGPRKIRLFFHVSYLKTFRNNHSLIKNTAG